MMLIVDDRWLLIGPNRHGAVYACRVLESAFKTRPAVGPKRHHVPLCDIPESVRRGLTIVGMIRCPLRWYASKWGAYCQATSGKHEAFGEYFDRLWLDPQGSMGKAMEEFPKAVYANLGTWSYKHVAYHCEAAKGALSDMTQADLAATYSTLLSVDEMMCTETLTRDLLRVFGEEVRPHLRQPPNSSLVNRSDCNYGDERLRLIREKDGWLIRHYPNLQSHGVLT